MRINANALNEHLFAEKKSINPFRIKENQMAHKARVRGLTVRKTERHGVESSTPGTVFATTTEWLVECDKCGRIDKAGDEQTARARAARHEEMPHR